MSRREESLARVAGLAETLWTVLLLVGAVSAVFWQPGLWLMLAGFVGLVAGHLAIGVAGYRSVMRRSWPSVEPIDPDDDDDW